MKLYSVTKVVTYHSVPVIAKDSWSAEKIAKEDRFFRYDLEEALEDFEVHESNGKEFDPGEMCFGPDEDTTVRDWLEFGESQAKVREREAEFERKQAKLI